MTIRPDGTAYCNGCGDDIGNGSVAHAAAFNVMFDDGTIDTLHLGTACQGDCLHTFLPLSKLQVPTNRQGEDYYVWTPPVPPPTQDSPYPREVFPENPEQPDHPAKK